jgi:hypothetical protein
MSECSLPAGLPAARHEEAGWVRLHVEGAPYARGWQHGYLLAPEIRAAMASIDALLRADTTLSLEWFSANACAMWHDRLAKASPHTALGRACLDALEELRGIADGANAAARDAGGADWIGLQELIGWNGYPELICQWWPLVASGHATPAIPIPPAQAAAAKANLLRGPAQLHQHFHHTCSAFIATGAWTRDGGIVAAHTTWQRFANGQHYNILLSLAPQDGQGHAILMQTSPGYLASSMDFGLNAAGLVVVSTSIDGQGFDPDGLPEFVRARRAQQHASSIEEWRALFREGNNGGYANSWLLAEARTGRIAAYELTLAHEAMQPVLASGYYAGCNIPLSPEIRVFETRGNAGYDDILRSGARRVRFDALMATHKGGIDAARAQEILADHHDVYLGEDKACGRTICGHFDTDDNRFAAGHQPYYPWGSLDGKVTTGGLAAGMAMQARWGRACGTPFDADAFFARQPQYRWMQHLTRSRPHQPWIEARAGLGAPAGQ